MRTHRYLPYLSVRVYVVILKRAIYFMQIFALRLTIFWSSATHGFRSASYFTLPLFYDGTAYFSLGTPSSRASNRAKSVITCTKQLLTVLVNEQFLTWVNDMPSLKPYTLHQISLITRNVDLKITQLTIFCG